MTGSVQYLQLNVILYNEKHFDISNCDDKVNILVVDIFVFILILIF